MMFDIPRLHISQLALMRYSQSKTVSNTYVNSALLLRTANRVQFTSGLDDDQGRRFTKGNRRKKDSPSQSKLFDFSSF
jgi:hypothetical protein